MVTDFEYVELEKELRLTQMQVMNLGGVEEKLHSQYTVNVA